MTAATALARDTFLQQQSNQIDSLGQVIAWELPTGTNIKYVDLVDGLQRAGLETKVARQLLPRYAFARAAHKMSENRIIRSVVDDPNSNTLTFQFTKEFLQGDKYEYQFETNLILHKDTGRIECQLDGLRQMATELLQQAIENRTTADITRVVKRLFEKKADLFPVKADGGVYFVPEKYSAFVDQVEQLIQGLRGRLIRMEVPAGSKHAQNTVKGAVEAGLNQLIQEHAEAVESFGLDNRPSTLEKAMRRIDETKFKLEAYSAYLETLKPQMDERLALIRLQLREKIGQLMAHREAANA